MKVEILNKGLEGFTGEAWLLKRGDRHFVASNAFAPLGGPETLVFPSDSEGQVKQYLEVCGGREQSLAGAVSELEALGDDELDA